MALSPSNSAVGQKKAAPGASGSSSMASTVYSSIVPSLMHPAAAHSHSFSNEGIEAPRNFLSLYSEPSSQRSERRFNQGVSTYLTTQDFLPPLERGGKNKNVKEDGSLTAAAALEEHILPGGIGTYTISHISRGNQDNGKSELPANVLTQVNGAEGKLGLTRGRTHGSSGSGMLTLWEECIVMDGGRTFDGLGEGESRKEYQEQSDYWSTVRPKISTTDLSFHAKDSFGHSLQDITEQRVPSSRKQQPDAGQGFIEITKKPKKFLSEDDEDEDEEYLDRNRENRKESLFQKDEVLPKEDRKSSDQRAITPRSKHSATEQRRRSKINDRFQTLRELVPHSDQKRDKASFLLEVIEYLQVLQEKVHKYETQEQCWNEERMKNMAWDLQKRSSGLREVPMDSSGADGTHLESKPTSEGGDLNRPRLSSAAVGDEYATLTADLLPNSSQNSLQFNVSSPISHGCAPLYVENESTGSFNKPIPLTFSMEHSLYPPNGRSFTHPICPKVQAATEKNSLPCMQTISAGSGVPTNVWFLDKERPSDSGGAARLCHLQGNNNTTTEASDGPENQRPDLRLSPKLSTQQDPGWNQGTSLKADAAETRLPTKFEPQHVITCFNNMTTIAQSESEPEAEIAARQSQQHAASSGQQKIDESWLAVHERDQFVIQGGIINVSSIYSQGLLDTLTRALQSSGLDLSQASISVQIDLGRRGGTSVAAINSKEFVHNQEESSQNHRAQGQLRAADTTSESVQPPKKLKIEHHF